MSQLEKQPSMRHKRLLARSSLVLRDLLKELGCFGLRGCLVILYAPLKLLPVRSGKLLFLSRQADTPSVDARLLFDELKRRDPSVEIVCICKRIRPGLREKGLFVLCLLRSLYHLSTSQVCVLDSYWPAVSVLKHKRTLKVVQMWHALGKIKRSGWQTVGLPGGRSKAVARVMKMHAGYNIVIAGGRAWNQFYCASFGIDESIIRNTGLPRIDYMLNQRATIKKTIIDRFPLLENKTVVLFAPTFRKDGGGRPSDLIKALDCDRYCVVVKAHPNELLNTQGLPVVRCPGVSALEMLSVAEYLITDYSAIALEAAALNVKTLYYVPDYERYRTENGLNIDLYQVMPQCVFSDPTQLADALEQAYPQGALDAYRQKYLFDNLGHSAQAIADVVMTEAGLSCALS